VSFTTKTDATVKQMAPCKTYYKPMLLGDFPRKAELSISRNEN